MFTLDLLVGRWATDISFTVSQAEAMDARRWGMARNLISVGSGRDPELFRADPGVPEGELWVVGDRLASDRGPDMAAVLRGVGRAIGCVCWVCATVSDVAGGGRHLRPRQPFRRAANGGDRGAAVGAVGCSLHHSRPGQIGDREKNRLLVPSRDVAALATALRQLVADKNICAAMGTAGRMPGMQCYNAAIVTARTLGALGL